VQSATVFKITVGVVFHPEVLPFNTTVSNNPANSVSQLTLNIYLYISSFANVDHVYASWIICIISAFFVSVSSDTTLHVYTDNINHVNCSVAEFTFHTLGMFNHQLITCDCIFVQFNVIHHVLISSDVTILGTGTMYHAVFINTQLYVQSIFGVTVRFAAFVLVIVFNARSHSNKLRISNSFLLCIAEYIYSLSVSGSVGTSFRFLDRFETTVDQKNH
jgi:hypothetical protein